MQNGVTLAKGEVLEVPNLTSDIRITSTGPFAVTQFVYGRSKGDDLTIGGPSQVTLPPSSQFRTSYAFAAPSTYDQSYAAIMGPTGAAVSLDGQKVPLDNAVGASGMSVGRAALKQNDRVHVVQADKPVGVVVYGYSPYASYAYAGGLDLRHAPAAP
jgi:hypothetical protein